MTLPSSISLELVPRTLDDFRAEVRDCFAGFPVLSALNIPEIRSVPVKSYEPSLMLLKDSVPVIPHFRLIDRSLPDLFTLLKNLVEAGLRKVLLIGGDPPKEAGFTPSGVTTLEAIRAVKREFPGLKVYAGLDPYRTSFREELDYALRKIDVGSDGFFTQPFFSQSLLEVWTEQFRGTETWFGIAPVYSEKSKKYWEQVNKVVFPPEFSFSKEYNANLAARLLKAISLSNQSAYLMPIAVSAKEYLNNILNADV
jgi:methylenetetrahydrofolate reductase (NADPH)